MIQNTVANQPLLLNPAGRTYLFFPANGHGLMSQPEDDLFANGDIDIQAKISSYNLAINYQGVFNKTGANGFSLLLYTFNSRAAIEVSLNGTDTTFLQSSVVIPYNSGEVFWLRATRTASTGVVRFYTRLNDSDAWAQLGTDVSGPSGVVFNNGLSKIGVGGHDAINIDFYGNIYQLSASSTIGGDPVLIMDPTAFDRSKNQEGFISKTGHEWTMYNSTVAGHKAEIVDRILVQGNGTTHFLRSGAFTWNQPGYVYGVLRNYSPGIERGLWDGHSIFQNGLYTNAADQLEIIVNSGLLNLTNPQQLGMIVAKYAQFDYSIRFNRQSPLVSSSSQSGNWSGFTLLSRGNSTTMANATITAIVGTKSKDTAEQQHLIKTLMEFTHGRIFE
jgi:hypothetical protein